MVEASSSTVSHLFDSNAVRQLAGQRQWGTFLAKWNELGFTSGWTPWVLSETTGTNLYRRGKGVSQSEFEILQRAVKRMDDLAAGRILSDPDRLLWRDAFRTAGMDVPPFPGIDRTSDCRRGLDCFLSLKRVSQVEFEPQGKELIIILHGTGEAWAWRVPHGFREAGRSLVDELKERAKCDKNSSIPQHVSEMKPCARFWLLEKAKALQIPDHVMAKAIEKFENLASTSWCKGIIHAWYLQRKAAGLDLKAAKENDYRDQGLASYQSETKFLVTDDVGLTELAQSLFAGPERAITYESFRQSILASSSDMSTVVWA